jgi:hypothetical protein
MSKEIYNTVQEFISLHNEYNAEHLQSQPVDVIYSNILNDLYGETRDLGDGWVELEISGLDSFNGNPVLFNFPYSI